MPQTFDDLERLMARLKRVARELPEPEGGGHEAPEPPMFAHQRLIDELKAAREDGESPLLEPRRPRLAELLAMDREDEAFVRGLYRHLLGREPDPEGLANYLGRVPRVGRLYALAAMMASDESRRFRDSAGLEVEHEGRLLAPLAHLTRWGRFERLIRPALIGAYRAVESVSRRHWRLEVRGCRTQARLQQLYGQMISVLADVDGQLGRLDHFLVHQQANDAEVRALREQQAALWSTQQHQRRAFERTLEAEPAPRDEIEPARVREEMLDAYYVAFEAACRGSEEEILGHLRHYLVQVDQARQAGHRAIDLGCGRGEWLSLLTEEGFRAVGVDLNIAMVEHCREHGLEARHQDALGALRALPDDSQALVSGFHIAEHLPFEVLYALVDEAQRVLAPGGVLILETPNPENLLVGSHTFYHDPTHRNPLTPTAMQFLLTYLGFGDVEVRRFNPYPADALVPGDDPLTQRVNGHLCGPQDYAVVGRKAAPGVTAAEDEESVVA